MRYTEGYLAGLSRAAADESNITGLSGKTVLVTGASGLVGSALDCGKLAELGFSARYSLADAGLETVE